MLGVLQPLSIFTFLALFFAMNLRHKQGCDDAPKQSRDDVDHRVVIPVPLHRRVQHQVRREFIHFPQCRPRHREDDDVNEDESLRHLEPDVLIEST